MNGGERFRAAVETKDLDAILACLAEDMEFRSPVVFKPYHGRESIRTLLGIIMEVFEDFRYTAELHDGDRSVLVFETRVGDREVQGLDLLRYRDDGLVAEFTVMVRPLSAAIALAETVGPRLRLAGYSRS